MGQRLLDGKGNAATMDARVAGVKLMACFNNPKRKKTTHNKRDSET